MSLTPFYIEAIMFNTENIIFNAASRIMALKHVQ